jgi:hypothetical protein
MKHKEKDKDNQKHKKRKKRKYDIAGREVSCLCQAILSLELKLMSSVAAASSKDN